MTVSAFTRAVEYLLPRRRSSGKQNLSIYSDLSDIFLCATLSVLGVLPFFVFPPFYRGLRRKNCKAQGSSVSRGEYIPLPLSLL